MLKASWDVGNDFKPERKAETRGRHLKAFRWLAFMTATGAAGLLTVEHAPTAAGHTWRWGERVAAHVWDQGATPFRDQNEASVATSSGRGADAPIALLTTMRVMQVLLVVFGVVTVMANVLRLVLDRPSAMYFIGGVGCFAFAPLVDGLFVMCRVN